MNRDWARRNSGESLEWVPKVQGYITESLRQKDRADITKNCASVLYFPELLFKAAFYF